jgi:hypothetical protein
MNEFVNVVPECGDWEAWYLNGKLIVEGHSVSGWNMLDALADVFSNTIRTVEISDEVAEMGFTENLEDMINS